MSSAFQTLRDKAYRDVFLSEDYFAERVLLLPETRSLSQTDLEVAILAAIEDDQYVTCTVSESKLNLDADDDGTSLTGRDEIIIQVCRDPDAENTDEDSLGGIATPTLRDGLLRDALHDPAQKPYFCVREASGHTEVLWRLVYSRSTPLSRGPK